MQKNQPWEWLTAEVVLVCRVYYFAPFILRNVVKRFSMGAKVDLDFFISSNYGDINSWTDHFDVSQKRPVWWSGTYILPHCRITYKSCLAEINCKNQID